MVKHKSKKAIFNLLFTVTMLSFFAVQEFQIPSYGGVQPDNAVAETNIVRVGISNTSFSDYKYTSVELASDEGLTVYDTKNSKKLLDLPKDSILNISYNNRKFKIQYYREGEKKNTLYLSKSPQVMTIVPVNGLTKVLNLKRGGKEAYYRGVFEVLPFESAPDKFALVNVIGIEDYLRGVVPNEMPVHFGHEALKAQAVAARNYVLKPRVKPYKEYDICDSVACQVYFGAGTESPLSDFAVSQTENNVATYKGDLILAQYSSTAGGYTESYENAFNSSKYKEIGNNNNAIPYLVGKPDNKKTPVLDNDEAAREFYTKHHNTFDNKSPYFRWEREWEKSELEDVLAKNITKSSFKEFVTVKNPSVKEFGKLQNIEVVKRGVSGKVIELKITTDKNEYSVQKELVIRQLFQKDGKNLPSANIVFEFKNSSDKVLNHKRFELFGQKTAKDTEIAKIKVYGGGYGHGVGMSQFGAGKMQELGYKYDEILQHYYTGISISTPKVDLNSTTKHYQKTQSFYANAKKGYMYIDGYNAPNKLNVNLNGYIFEFNFDKKSKTKVYTDISEYIREGRNQVTYSIPQTGSGVRKITAYIELKGAVDE